ncbi:MAG TPA: polysaccharide deacetylase family protein [Actinomycetota bacterium]|nr:polysaccharide deacetylase family protein [Actinomycetota bacterium]
MSEPFRVALTFDAEHPDRPGCPPGNAERIVETLAGRGVTATFFVQGRWAEAYPVTARRIAEDGHLIGHHSHYHARMPLLVPNGVPSDLADGAAAIEAATGRDPRPWFRCPFGAGHDDPDVQAALEELGYRDVGWHVELEDWEAHRTGEAITADGLRGTLEHGDGAVVLLHTWPAGTGDAVGPLVDGLREAGATFVTVADLETLP